MKTKLLLSLSIFFFVEALFAQTSGGPDAYGYTWKNQADPNGPAYNWKEIKGVGTQITGLSDDNQKGPYSLGWNFHYYWADYGKIWVGSNGWLAFQNNSVLPAATFPTIPNTALPNNYLAAMSCDLTFIQTNLSAVPGATAWYWTNNTDSLILQYDSIPYWVTSGSGFSGRHTFQVILSGADSSITYQYKLIQTGTVAYDMAGEGLTTGIENSSGQIGLQVSTNVFPAANTSVKFYYPNPVTYQVFDATPAWSQNIDNGGFFVSANGSPLKLATDVYNAGNQPLSNIVTNGKLLNSVSTKVWDTTVTVSSLVASADSMFIFPKTYDPNITGTYTYRTTATASGDINAANNITDVEMVVVDTTQATIPLSYVTSTTAGTANDWGGNGGQGIYIEPPFYPATITSLDFMVANSGTVGYHLVQILDDKGPGNTPGNIIYIDSVAASAAVIGSYNNVPVTKDVVILSGGVYVAWMENGDATSAIGTEGTSPLSNRNYEIIGSWSSYRNNAIEDIMIQVNITRYNFGAIASATTPDACPTNGSGSGTVTVTAGTSPPYTYLWSSGGQTTATATGLAAGNHTVTITDSLGIISTTIFSVYNNIAVTASTASVTCFGGNTGTSTATIGGTAPYTYLWSNGQTNQAATGLTVGIYTVTASNTDGCSNFAIDTIDGPAALANTFSVTPATCVGGNGTAASTVTGGTAPYTYLWNNLQTTAIATGLATGSYSLSVTDANGCTFSTSTTVSTIPFVSSAASTPANCTGGGGSATATATSGGTAPYMYVWLPSGQTTQTATGLSAGSHTVTVTDSVGCTSSTITTVSTIPFVSSAASTPANCTGVGGSATATATSGGTAPYIYAWLPSGQTTQTATGLSAGSYTVTVTDSVGCTSSTMTTVSTIPFVSSTASTPTKCAGTNDGVATSVASSGGTAPYTYAWSTGQTTQAITGLAAGTYTVVTTDAVGCSTVLTTTVISPAAMTASSTSQPATYPNFNNGTATGNATGGTAPYTYAWSNGVTAQTITGLSSGNYTVCVTDLYGCTACDTVNVLLNGINEIYNGVSVVISPNPFNSSAFVKIDFVNPTHNDVFFTVFDLYGKEVQSIDLREYKGATIGFTLNRGYTISSGMYFYRLEDDKGILYAGKLLVQ
ncbi:MAG: T9SS type A sorting domain-containing protein [Bacteroidetes bacterium]|nr:MAG: T9SS type A sorting domain-containing protein [Bacteroidota bacterium]